jgi:uncharacterized membrane protein YphA (DoxX/SURF4 family)
MTISPGLNKPQSIFLVLLRILIGWHLLYEGIAKLLIPEWSAEAYLLNSRWVFAPVFHWMASTEGILATVDFLNIWGLIIIGFLLIPGLFTRYFAIGGMVLLGLYYIANPPFIGTDFGIPREGHYLFINKTLIEIAALGLLAVFPSGLYFGIDRFLRGRSLWLNYHPEGDKTSASTSESSHSPGEDLSGGALPRREVLRYLTMVPILGAFAWGAVRKFRWNSVNATSGASITVPNIAMKDLVAPIPAGKILDKKVSRIIAGGNLIGGWSHSRDLRYVSKLFKAYNTEKKVFETLAIAEQAGINTINIVHNQLPLINKYKRIYGSNIQTMTQVHPKKDEVYLHVDFVIEHGVDLIQIQGNCCDWRVRDGEIDVLADCMDYIKKQGYPAGLGAHSIQALIACDEAGIEPDFFMKTFHHDNYWSAHPRENRIPFSVDGKRSSNHDEFHDNMFCLFHEETAEYMSSKKIPWIAFKILAGGAIMPEDGFRFAFENGADFICVGMFDWQVVENVNIANKILGSLNGRSREWYG